MVYFGRISCGESRFGDRHSQVRWRFVFGVMIKKHMGVASHLLSRWYRTKSWSCWFDHHDSTHVFSGGFLGTATFSGFGALVELGWAYIPLRHPINRLEVRCWKFMNHVEYYRNISMACYFSKMIHHMFYHDFMACGICFMMATPLLSRSQKFKKAGTPENQHWTAGKGDSFLKTSLSGPSRCFSGVYY